MPLTLKDAEAQAKIAAVGAEVMVVAAYGSILPQAMLDMPRFAVSIFMVRCCRAGSGAAPIQRALLAGDGTGVCIMQMEAGLDTGPVLLRGAFRSKRQIPPPACTIVRAGLGARLCVDMLGKLPPRRSAAAMG